MARNPFWTYSLRLYRRPGVSPACIALQDRAGAQVNMLLLCLWMGRQGLALNAASLAAALKVTRQGAGVVEPLRQARRALKPLALSSREVNRIRQAVLRLEVQAERLEQDQLYALVRTVRTGRGERVMIAADNLGAYFRKAGIRLAARDWTALQTIVRAAF